MTDRAQVLIVGGGIVGTGLAWALARRGVDGVVVVDLDLAGLYASSELNAGGARATWWQDVNIESCRVTLDFFRENADEFSFRDVGYLWLYDDADLHRRALEVRRRQNAAGLGVEAWSVADVARRFPLLDRNLDELVGATWSPRDGLVNPNAVRQGYRARAEALGVTFLNRHYVTGVRTALHGGAGGVLRRVVSVEAVEVARGDPSDEDGTVLGILTGHHVPARAVVREHVIECERVVNSLGAWSPVFSAKIGVRDVTEPVRRQIALVDVQSRDLPDPSPLEGLGMVVDASDLYFHPEGPYVLAGYSLPDEPPGFDFHYDGEPFFEQEIWPRLAHRASAFERCGHVRGWSGLYAVTPDRSGIAGPVAGFSNLCEAHSFTGRGVMQSWGIANNLASWMASGEWDDVDLSPLSRDRFEDPARRVEEALHI
ncbi:MAG: NAD(P)/FAD-dependent oxidoreductase [Myxococcota bacterium]